MSEHFCLQRRAEFRTLEENKQKVSVQLGGSESPARCLSIGTFSSSSSNGSLVRPLTPGLLHVLICGGSGPSFLRGNVLRDGSTQHPPAGLVGPRAGLENHLFLWKSGGLEREERLVLGNKQVLFTFAAQFVNG